MQVLSDTIIHFFQGQRYTVISTIDEDGFPHNACKGIVDINTDGRVYLLDLYMGKTYENLKKNPRISITAVDEHKFAGYCLQGKAHIVKKEHISPALMKRWEKKITGRITHRLLKNIQGEKGHSQHPEALLPEPVYLISVQVEKVIDLMPHHIKEKE